ncbi:MAG: MSCRAMM family adhesin SdrC [Deltaproteobacteria bacterium]|nr:MSCRAMM family adhesin SdrC [Deltaproteobacteria bacterium]
MSPIQCISSTPAPVCEIPSLKAEPVNLCLEPETLRFSRDLVLSQNFVPTRAPLFGKPGDAHGKSPSQPAKPMTWSDGVKLLFALPFLPLSLFAGCGETVPSHPEESQALPPEACEPKDRFACKKGVVPDPDLDSDCDGIRDTSEDRNHNCIVDFDESDPYLVDSDADGLKDGAEDQNKNGEWDPEEGETATYLQDSDFDGITDLNDPCPLNPSPACSTKDSDVDSIPDDADNCPVNPNVSQTDSDRDGIGDACE